MTKLEVPLIIMVKGTFSFFGRFIALITFVTVSIITNAQTTLRFSGKDTHGSYVQPSFIIIENITRNWSDTLFYPDTVLNLSGVGIDDHTANTAFSLSNNIPNPFRGTTDFSLFLTENENVEVAVFSVFGKQILHKSLTLSSGTHRFKVWVNGSGCYQLCVKAGNETTCIKMLNVGESGKNSIEYLGEGAGVTYSLKSWKGNSDQPFAIGDEMRFTARTVFQNVQFSSDILQQAVMGDDLFLLTFSLPDTSAFANHCPGIPFVTDVDGNIYNTVQIGEQCWMRENLRTKHYANGYAVKQGTELTSDDVFYYYPQSDSSLVNEYGLLYNWIAVMHGSGHSSTNPSEVQGLCPDGWHTPSGSEWTQLINYVWSHGEYNCCGCDYFTAKALSANYGWNPYSDNNCHPGYGVTNNNSTGFSALPAGLSGSAIGMTAHFATTSYEISNSLMSQMVIMSFDDEVSSYPGSLYDGYSVRCVLGSTSGSGTAVSETNCTVISDSTVVLQSHVTHNGAGALTATGFCWSESPFPEISGNHGVSGVDTGNFQLTLGDLQPGQKYYVRAYATTTNATVYGPQMYFWLGFLPTVTTGSVTEITGVMAFCEGEVLNDGNLWTPRGFCWSTSHNPTLSDAHAEWGSGTGYFRRPLINLMPNTTYYVRAYATNQIGTAYGNEVSFTTISMPSLAQPCSSTPSLTDYDGNTYNTVQIGTQCWMRENLRTTHYSNGDEILAGTNSSYDTAYRYVPNGDSSEVATHGYLYNWAAVMHGSLPSNAVPSGVQGICPTGWHVPSDAEWDTLEQFVSFNLYPCQYDDIEDMAVHIASQSGWQNSQTTCSPGYNPSNNNQTGFSIMPSGATVEGWAWGFGQFGSLWSATEENSIDSRIRLIEYNHEDTESDSAEKSMGFSVRCIKD